MSGVRMLACVKLLAALLLVTEAQAGALDEGKAAFAARNYSEAYRLFSEAATSGEADGLYYKARMLELGLIAGAGPDPVAALGLYRQAVGYGHARALNRLGLAYYRGESGIGRDDKRAVELFSQAERAGDSNAAFNLGRMYSEGRGVARDADRALALYEKAAANDHVLALNTLAVRYKMSSLAGARKTAEEYFGRSAALGNAVGLYETGLAALHAGSAREHLIAAHKYFNLAAARGHPGASQALADVAPFMTPADVLQAQAEAKAFRAKDVSDAK